MSGIDIACLMATVLAGTFVVAAGLAIGMGHKSNLPDGAKRVDEWHGNGLLSMLVAVVEGFPHASRQLRVMLLGSAAVVLVSAVVWVVMSFG